MRCVAMAISRDLALTRRSAVGKLIGSGAPFTAGGFHATGGVGPIYSNGFRTESCSCAQPNSVCASRLAATIADRQTQDRTQAICVGPSVSNDSSQFAGIAICSDFTMYRMDKGRISGKRAEERRLLEKG